MTGATVGDVRAIRHLVEAWQQVQTGQAAPPQEYANWPETVAELVAVQDRFVKAGRWTAGPSTLMDVLGLSRAEVSNCRVLRWLLDPLARHGIGIAMTTVVSEHLGSPLPSPHTARVYAEVARASSRADLVIEDLASGRTIVIEAKVDATEGLDQGRRLEADWPEATSLAFLTVSGTRLPTTCTQPERWRTISWHWIADQVDRALSAASEPTGPRAAEARQAAIVWVASTRRNLQ